jgi:alpha-beta hydrolase superfamily lysophospholipase
MAAGWPPNCAVSDPYLVCLPAGAPGMTDLVLYVHGYVAPDRPHDLSPDDLTFDGVSLPGVVTSLGFAFMTRVDLLAGLAVLEGVADAKAMAAGFASAHPERPLRRVYLAGASEGGLVATKAVEESGSPFSGGLALCGPIGGFRKQVDHIADFRVVFDYFFPGQIPGSPVEIPADAIDNWESTYEPSVTAALAADPTAAGQLFSVTKVPAPPGEAPQTAAGLLWYNVFATNDARQKLGGQPFDNNPRLYLGSLDPLALNLGVQRFDADPAAVAAMQDYETTGTLPVPLVTMHTLGDPIVPYWHETQYTLKTLAAGQAHRRVNIPILRAGHCTFTPEELLVGFGVLVLKVAGQELADVAGAIARERGR